MKGEQVNWSFHSVQESMNNLDQDFGSPNKNA